MFPKTNQTKKSYFAVWMLHCFATHQHQAPRHHHRKPNFTVCETKISPESTPPSPEQHVVPRYQQHSSLQQTKFRNFKIVLHCTAVRTCFGSCCFQGDCSGLDIREIRVKAQARRLSSHRIISYVYHLAIKRTAGRHWKSRGSGF